MNVLIRFTGGVLLFVFLASCDDPPTDQSQSCMFENRDSIRMSNIAQTTKSIAIIGRVSNL